MEDKIFNSITVLLICTAVIMIFNLLYANYFVYKITYKKIKLGDVYYKKPTNPWDHRVEVIIYDKKDDWIKLYDTKNEYIFYLNIEQFVYEGYKLVKTNK